MNSSPRRKSTLACVSFLSALILLCLSGTSAQAGTLDTSFGMNGITVADPAPSLEKFVRRIIILPNGKILVGGNAGNTSIFNYMFTPVLIQLNSDGTLDTSFGTGGTVNTQLGNFIASDMIVQPDGKIVVVGGVNFTTTSPPQDFAVMRFNSDGSRDATFGTNGLVITSIGGGYDTAVGAVVLPGGKLLVSGYTYGTSTSPGTVDFVRYNNDGTLDQTFGEGGIVYYFTGAVNDVPSFNEMVVLPDGKFLLHSNYTISRRNADTTLDTTFGTNGFAFTSSYEGQMTVQPDGKILIAGYFQPSTGSDTYLYSLARLMADGSLDTGFGTNGRVLTQFRRTTAGYYYRAIGRKAAVKSNGDIIMVGYVDDVPYNNNTHVAMGVASYSSNGTLLAKTVIGAPDYLTGDTVAIQPDNKIVTAGNANIAGNAGVGIARLLTVTNDSRPFRRNYDFNGDNRTDIMVYRPGQGGQPGVWYSSSLQRAYALGQEGDIIAPADFDSDGVTDMAVFRPSNGTWYFMSSHDGSITAFQWGTNGDVPVASDYDGDGKDDFAVFRPSNGYWYILNSADNTFKFVPFGLSGDKPVVGDYDGDGKCDISVWRPSNGTWYIAKSTTGEYQIVQFGTSGDIPVQADYNGDNRTDLAVFRPSTGTWYTSTDPATNYGAVPFGLNGDIPVAGDYDGDGKADIAVWRPTSRVWYVRQSTNGQVFAQQWGISTDIPAPGN